MRVQQSNHSLPEKTSLDFSPASVLLGAQAVMTKIPTCDHYSGDIRKMEKSLQLQAQLYEEFGEVCVVDVTLDCEDGAAVGAEHEHAQAIAQLAQQHPDHLRVAVRVHAPHHPAFEDDVEIIVGSGARLSHVMIPKIDDLADLTHAIQMIDEAGGKDLPLHVLIESPRAVHNAFAIAEQPRVQSLSFGVMDFVSAFGGAISSQAMSAHGQFQNPQLVRAKLELAAACHASGKTPSHSVITEFKDIAALEQAARRAQEDFAFTRMWSIHPAQIRPIISAFTPPIHEVEQAVRIIELAQQVQWSPISYKNVLHDRASYRYYWHLIERAFHTGVDLPQEIRQWLVKDTTSLLFP